MFVNTCQQLACWDYLWLFLNGSISFQDRPQFATDRSLVAAVIILCRCGPTIDGAVLGDNKLLLLCDIVVASYNLWKMESPFNVTSQDTRLLDDIIAVIVSWVWVDGLYSEQKAMKNAVTDISF